MEHKVLKIYEEWKKKEMGEEFACQVDGYHIHPQYEWLGGSPDGLVGGDGLVEIKCPFNQQFAKLSGPLSLTYYLQCQTLLWSYGRQFIDFVMYAGPQRGCSVRRVTVDYDLFRKLLPVLEVCKEDIRTKKDMPRAIQSKRVKEWIGQSQLFNTTELARDIL